MSEAVNQAPTAAFTTQVDGLSIDVDGSSSDDPDGSISSYSWDWDDGSPTAPGSWTRTPMLRRGPTRWR